MPSPPNPDAFRLPAGSRLLHIGPVKTGTTAIQAAASEQRQALLDHGVRYPGANVNHRHAFGGLTRWATRSRLREGPLIPDRLGVDSGGVPGQVEWEELKAEIDSDPSRRIFLSAEFVSQTDDATCQQIVQELGPDRLHVVITLRPPAVILPSWWAQSVKVDAQAEPFESWLSRIFDTDPDRPMSDRVRRFYDQGELVNRWARLAGPGRVTVVVGDKSQPTLLTDAFEALLGLPSGLLSRADDANRALTAPETTLFRRLNEILRDREVSWKAYRGLVRMGAVGRGLLQGPTRSGIDRRLRLPEWAGEAASRDGQRFADHICKTGVQVVGDLDTLGFKPQIAEQIIDDAVPLDVSVQALAGTVLAGQRLQRRLDKTVARLDTSTHRADDLRERNRQLESELAAIKQELSEEQTRPLDERVRSLSATDRLAHVSAAYTTRELFATLRRRAGSKLRTRGTWPRTPTVSARR